MSILAAAAAEAAAG